MASVGSLWRFCCRGRVVEADGVNSKVREILMGRASKPSYSGIAVFRAAFESRRMKGPPMADSIKWRGDWWGDDRYFLNYYMTGARGLTCIICGTRQAEWGMSVSSVPATQDEVRKIFSRLHPDVLRVRSC